MDSNLHSMNEALLLRYYEGTITDDEKEAIEQWIAQSEENRKLAKDIDTICFAAEILQTIQKIDPNEALQKVKKEIKKKHRISPWTWMQRVAVVLFIPLLTGLVYLYLTKGNEPVEYMEMRTMSGMVASVNLPDGSTVWLNSDSYLKYPTKFTGKTREVDIKGEAYFKVARNEKKSFVVHTADDLKVEVLGTEFNMDAYKETGFTATTLVKGSVRFHYKGSDNRSKELIMKPGQKVVYDEQTKQIALSEPYVPSEIAWKEGQIILRNTSLEQTLRILSRRFNVDFILKNSALKDNYFTGTFEKQQLPRILEHLRISTNIRYRIIDPEGGEKGLKERSKVELY